MKKLRFLLFVLGCCLLLFFVVLALFPSWFTPYERKQVFEVWLSPSTRHWLGTNALGYDIFTELVYGGNGTLIVGLSAGALSLLLGGAIGILSTAKGVVGVVANGLIDLFVLLPKLIVLIVLSVLFKTSGMGLILLIGCFSWANTARNVRAKMISLRHQPFIRNCSLYGFSPLHTAIYHVLPNLKDVLLSRFLLGTTNCIMLESTLSFLGIGDIYYPTWGVMIDLARSGGALMRGAYAYLFAPCVCIMLFALAFYAIAQYVEAKRDIVQESF